MATALRLLLVLLLVLPSGVSPAAAAGKESLIVRQARVVLAGDHLEVEVQLAGLFSQRVRETLERGLPTSLEVTADLWRHRRGWFDQLVSTRSTLYRIRYDAWHEDYDLQHGLEPLSHLDSIATVARALSKPVRVPLVARNRLETGQRYYVVVTASLRLLSPEGVQEIERFLADQLRQTGGQKGIPAGSRALGHLPGAILSILAMMTGLGDEIATYRTAAFES